VDGANVTDITANASGAALPKLKFLDATLYAVAMNIGLRWIAVAAADGTAAFPLWLVALFAFYVPLVAATAALTARFDAEGGIYAWARDSFGALPGFICGWFYWIALMPYFAGILYFLSGLIVSAVGADAKNTVLFLGISIGISAFVIAFQIAGLRYGKWLTNFGAAGSWAIFLTILAIAFYIASRGASATNFLHASYLPKLDFDTAILWGSIVFAFSGAESIAFLRNDIEGGMRTILRVLVISGGAIAFVYIVGTAALLVILPHADLTRLGGFPDALRVAYGRAGFGRFASIAIGLLALAQLGGFTGWFGIGARLPFAAGIDHFLPPLFARRNAKTGAPIAAILLQGGLMLVMVVLSQAGSSVAAAYDFLIAMSVLTSTIPYLFMFAAYLKFARADDVPGAWRMPGGVRATLIVGGVGQCATVIAIACTLVPSSSEPHPMAAFLKIVLSTAVMLGVGLLLYWLAARRRRAALVGPI
jgi:amino acid transporter